MNTRHLGLFTAAAIAWTTLAGCEDTGIFAGSGAGGGAGGAGGGYSAFCKDYCEQMSLNGCVAPDIDCLDSCYSTFSGYPGCDLALKTYYLCQEGALPMCPGGGVCSAEENAFASCITM